jgi:hypothetical protein
MTARAGTVGSAAALALVLLQAAARAQADDAGEQAQTLILGQAINRFAAKRMPVTFDIPGDRAAGTGPVTLAVVEARYCGALDAGRGRLIAVVRPAGAATATPLLDGPHDCEDKLEDVVQRRPTAGADATAIVEIIAAWVPWQLRFSVGAVASSGDGAAALGAALARAKATGPIETVDTAGIRLATERGAALNLDLALAFLKAGDAVSAMLTPAGRSDGRQRHPPPPDPSGVPAGTDAFAGATFPFGNRVLALFGQDGPLVLELDRQAVEIRGLQISGAEGTATVRGRATPRALRETFALAIDAKGPDLKVAEVRADPELENCGALSAIAALGCRARNAARSSAAATVALGMTNRYRGQLLRSLAVPPPFSFDIGGRPLTLRLTPTLTRSTRAGLVVYSKASLE